MKVVGGGGGSLDKSFIISVEDECFLLTRKPLGKYSICLQDLKVYDDVAVVKYYVFEHYSSSCLYYRTQLFGDWILSPTTY
jgi:hypothetical protein